MPRDFNRHERVAGSLRRELAVLIDRELKDPRLSSVTVSDVEVSRDISHARVFVNTRSVDDASETLDALNHAAGFLRAKVGSVLRMRSVPELKFFYDDSIERGSHLDALIEKANRPR